MNSIVIDLGGTNIKIGLIEHDKIITQTTIDAYSDKGFLERVPYLEKAIDELLKGSARQAINFTGIGIAVPGLVDTVAKRVLSINDKYNDSLGFDFVQWAKQKFNLPIKVENDARAALLGEWQYGAGKGIDNIAIMTFGTGIGTAVIIEGQLLRGKHYQAGCLGGHFTVNYLGKKCNCGNIGCVESEASSWGLASLIKNHPEYHQSMLLQEPKLDFKTLYQPDFKEDIVVKTVKEQCHNAWAAGLINLIHAYDPEMIILSGGVMGSADEIIPMLQERINNLAWTPWGKVHLKRAENINTAALFGMHYLVNTGAK